MHVQVGAHDRLGTQVFPLKSLQPNEAKEATLDLLESSKTNDSQKKKVQRGQIVVELMYAPFRDDSDAFFNGSVGSFNMSESSADMASRNLSCRGAGLLMVTVRGAHNVEGNRHSNPYVVMFFRGEKKISKVSAVEYITYKILFSLSYIIH